MIKYLTLPIGELKTAETESKTRQNTTSKEVADEEDSLNSILRTDEVTAAADVGLGMFLPVAAVLNGERYRKTEQG